MKTVKEILETFFRKYPLSNGYDEMHSSDAAQVLLDYLWLRNQTISEKTSNYESCANPKCKVCRT